MRLVALLPMKAHSERVPSKNFRQICGKPLFRWVLDTLVAINEIEAIVINTDAQSFLDAAGIGEMPGNEKILIRNRKNALRGDHVSMNRIILDDITAIPSDHYFMTHTTNPLLSENTIKKMIEHYFTAIDCGTADSLFSVNRLQSRFYSSTAQAINHDPNNLIRTQDLSPYMEENSAAYLFTKKTFAETGSRIGAKPLLFETPKLESVDIDDPSDWFIAESLLSRVSCGETLPGTD